MFEVNEQVDSGDGNCGDRQAELIVKHNSRYVLGIWHHAEIQSVSAIVGENGAGKTNLLELLCDILPRHSSNLDFQLHADWMVVQREQRVFVLYDESRYSSFAVTWIGEDQPEAWKHYKVHSISSVGSAGTRSGSKLGEILNDTSFIYYANVFGPQSGREEDAIPMDGFHDISTSFLVRRDVVGLTNLGEAEYADIPYNRLAAHFLMELLRNVKFIASVKDISFRPFNLPERLKIDPLYANVTLQKDEGQEPIIGIPDGFASGEHEMVKRFLWAALVSQFKDSNSLDSLGEILAGQQSTRLTVDTVFDLMRTTGKARTRDYAQIERHDLAQFLGWKMVSRRVAC